MGEEIRRDETVTQEGEEKVKLRSADEGEVEFGPEVSHDNSDSSVVKMDHVINK